MSWFWFWGCGCGEGVRESGEDWGERGGSGELVRCCAGGGGVSDEYRGEGWSVWEASEDVMGGGVGGTRIWEEEPKRARGSIECERDRGSTSPAFLLRYLSLNSASLF